MLLVVAWDGASFDVIDPLLAAGRMPVLAGVLARGHVRALESTLPPVTFPAWTSFATAASPGRHGVTDFTMRAGYRVRFLNASHRRLPSVWSLLSAAGRKVGVYALPATYPAEPVEGVLVCGFDTPLGPARIGERTFPPSLACELEARYGSLAVGGPSQTRIETGWHRRAIEQLMGHIRLRTRIVCELLTGDSYDFFLVHFSEPDTVSHQFWHLCDPASPRFSSDGPSDAIARVYEALDVSLGRLLAAAPVGADLMLLSDHGSGGTSDRAIAWNRWLSDHGYLAFRSSSAAPVARAARGLALAALPKRVQAPLFAVLSSAAGRIESTVRFAGIDWTRTTAFSEELGYQPAIWLNVRGREPEGTVEPEEIGAFVERLTEDLQAFRDPFDGGHVVERVLRREDVFDGPAAAQAPDLLLELRNPDGYSYAALPSRGGAERAPLRHLRAQEMTGARGTSMGGAHRLHGLCAIAGARVQPGRGATGTLADAGATALALAGLCVADGADGQPWAEIVAERALDRAPRTEPPQPPLGYGRDEERAVAERLRALGYLD
jgi:predicted AlkP superfamily phosphohydrolase/phosphomutase